MVGGLFQELNFLGAFWLAMSSAGVAWGLMWVTGLLVEDIEGQLIKQAVRCAGLAAEISEYGSAAGPVLGRDRAPSAEHRRGLVPGKDSFRGSVGLPRRVAAAFVVLVVACTPARVVDISLKPLPFTSLQAIGSGCGASPSGLCAAAYAGSLVWAIGSSCGRPAAESVGRRISDTPTSLATVRPIHGLLELGPRLIFSPSRISSCCSPFTSWQARCLPPADRMRPRRALMSSRSHVASVVFGFLELHLRRLSLSPLWCLVLFSLLGYAFPRDRSLV